MNDKVVRGRYVSKAAAALLALVVAFALSTPAVAHAATLQPASVAGAENGSVLQTQAVTAATTSKTVKKQSFTTKTKTIKKKATTVKAGTTKLKFSKGQGYVKFTAKKTKKYSFTFSDLNSTRSIYSAFVEVQTQDEYSPEYSFLTNVSTKGGKSSALHLAKKGYESKNANSTSSNLTKRTGKIKLKKGQDVYFYLYSSTSNASVKMKVA